MSFPISLEGKVALVTGGSQGIGAGISRALAKAGAIVLVASRREEKARELADALATEGGSAEGIARGISVGCSRPCIEGRLSWRESLLSQ